MLGQSRDGISGDTQDRRGLHSVQGKGGSAAGSGAFGATALSASRNGDAPSDAVNRAAPAASSPQLSLDTNTQGKAPPTIGTTSSMGSTSAGKWAHASWTSEERLDYVASLGIVNIPGEEVVLRFLSDAISRAPLPSPWHMARDEQGRTFFANRSTGASTWTHPLEPALRELAGVCRMCLTFPPALRESTISTLLETWQGEAKRELAKWYSVKHENGKEYYCHRETWEAMWEHPAEVVLPMHYLKIRSIERLRDEGYLAELRSQPVPAKRSAAAEVPALTDKSGGYPDSARGKNGTQLQPLSNGQAQQPAVAGRQAAASAAPAASSVVPAAAAQGKESIRRDATTLPGGMQAAQAAQAAQADAARTEAAIKEAAAAQEEAKKSRAALQDLQEVRKDLESQLDEASKQSAALRSELLHSEDELKAAYAAEERAQALEGELSDERKNTEQAHQDCTELSMGFRAALESVAEAERTKVFLEMRVAAMYQDEGARDSILEGQDDFTRAYLLAAYQEEDERREKILGLDEVRLNLEYQLEQLMHQQQGLHSELQAADKELAESRAMAHDFKDFAHKAEMELEKERQLVREATAKASDLVVSRDDAFRQKEAMERKLATVEEELKESKATEVVKTELEAQLAEATATKETMQQELTRAEEELSHTKMLGDANKERAIQAEGQLAADRRHFDHALEMMRDAERAKGLLEARLVNVEQDLQEQSALTAKVTALRAEIEEERKASQNGDFVRRELESQLRQSSSNEEKFRLALSEAEAELRVAKVRGEGISEQALQTASELAQARGQVEEKERLLQDLLIKKQADVDSRVSELQDALAKEQERQASLELGHQDREVQERKLREALVEEQARVATLKEKYQLAESTSAKDAQERLQLTGSELDAARAQLAEKERLLQEATSKAQGMSDEVASAASRLADAQQQLAEKDRVVALSEELKAAEANMAEGMKEQVAVIAAELAEAHHQVAEKDEMVSQLVSKQQGDVNSQLSVLREALDREQQRQAALSDEVAHSKAALEHERREQQEKQDRLQLTGSELDAARAQLAEKEQMLREAIAKAQGMDEQVAAAASRLDDAQQQLAEKDRMVARVEELKAAEAHMAEDMREQVAVIAAELAEAHHQVAEKDEMVSQLLSTQQGDANSQLSVLREALEREQHHQAALSDEVAHSKAALEHERREQQEKQDRLQLTGSELAAARAQLAEKERLLQEATSKARGMDEQVASAASRLADAQQQLAEKDRMVARVEELKAAEAQMTEGMREQVAVIAAELAEAHHQVAEKDEMVSQLLSKQQGDVNSQLSVLREALEREQERQAVLSDEVAHAKAALEHERREQAAEGAQQAQVAGAELADAQAKLAEKEELLSQLLSNRDGEVNQVSELSEALAREQERQAILKEEIAKSNATLEHERREQKEQQEKLQAALAAQQQQVAALSEQHEAAAAEVAKGVEQAQLAGYELADARAQLAEKEELLAQLLSKEKGDVNSQISVLQEALSKEQERHVALSDEVAHSKVQLEHERHEQEQKQEKLQAALVAEQARVAALSEQHEMATAQVAKGVERSRLTSSELEEAQSKLAEKEQMLQDLVTKSQVDVDGRILALQNALTQEKEKHATLEDARREQEAQELQLRKDLAERQETERGLQLQQQQQAAALETAVLQEQQMQKLLATAESELARERELVQSATGRVQASEHGLAALRAKMAYGEKERENDVKKLQEALAKEKERAAQLEASRKQQEAVQTRAAVEARLAKVEAEKSKREVALAAVEKQLKEKEQILLASDALESRLKSVEENLKSQAKEKEKKQAAESDERVRALEEQLAQERKRQEELEGTHTSLQAAHEELAMRLSEAAAWQGKLTDELSSAERELRSTKAVAEDFRKFASEAETALAQERKLSESAQQQKLEHSMGMDGGRGVGADRVTLPLRSAASVEQSFAAKIAAIEGNERVATVSYSPEDTSPQHRDPGPIIKDQVSDAMGAEFAHSITSDYSSSRHSRIDQWEPAATKFFSKLDRRNTGCVECFQVLQLWPVLSRHVECANAAALAAQMLQSPTPITTVEWMALMKALHSIVGPRRLRRNIRSAEAYYAELQSSVGMTDMPGLPPKQFTSVVV